MIIGIKIIQEILQLFYNLHMQNKMVGIKATFKRTFLQEKETFKS